MGLIECQKLDLCPTCTVSMQMPVSQIGPVFIIVRDQVTLPSPFSPPSVFGITVGVLFNFSRFGAIDGTIDTVQEVSKILSSYRRQLPH